VNGLRQQMTSGKKCVDWWKLQCVGIVRPSYGIGSGITASIMNFLKFRQITTTGKTRFEKSFLKQNGDAEFHRPASSADEERRPGASR